MLVAGNFIMFFKAVVTFALAFLSVGVGAIPLFKHDGNNDSELVRPRTLAALLTVHVLLRKVFLSLAVSSCRWCHGSVSVI